MRHIGLSSHTPQVVNRALDLGLPDLIMFSINPGYDYHHGDYAIGDAQERAALYRRCEKEGVGISVMKAFSGGQLLDAKTSPFGQALTEYQCIQYALDKPGVLTVLPGVRDRKDLERVLGFLDAPARSGIMRCWAPSRRRTCPACASTATTVSPAGGAGCGSDQQVLRSGRAGDQLARGHYDKLEKKAGACIQCGHCRQPLSLPGAAGPADAGDRRLFRRVNRCGFEPRRHAPPRLWPLWPGQI